jgi:hypothetical protein
MIRDFVTARSNLQTGLIIKSPILERPKAKTTKTGVDENYLSVEGEIQSGKLEADSIYKSGYGDGSDFYQGQLSGSVINVYYQFETRNKNPYL